MCDHMEIKMADYATFKAPKKNYTVHREKGRRQIKAEKDLLGKATKHKFAV